MWLCPVTLVLDNLQKEVLLLCKTLSEETLTDSEEDVVSYAWNPRQTCRCTNHQFLFKCFCLHRGHLPNNQLR